MIRLFSHPLIPRSLWIGLFGFGLVIHMTMLVLPIYSLQIFDRVLGSGSLETLVVLTVAVVVALIGQVLLEQARARLLTGWAAGLDETYAAAIADRAIRRPPPGEIVSDGRLAGLMAFAAGKGPSALLDVVWAPAYIMVLSLLHPWLGGLAALALAALCALAWLWSRFRAIRPSSRGVRWIEKEREAVRSLGLDAEVAGWWGRETKPARRDWEETRAGRDSFNALLRFVRGLLQVSIMALGAYLVVDGQATPGVMIAGSILALRAVGPVEGAIMAMKGFRLVRPTLDYLNDLRPEKIEERTRRAGTGELKARGLTYVPGQSGAPLLHGVDIHLSSGSLVRIEGSSGSGKTTLAEILSGLRQPHRGVVQLGGRRLGDMESPRVALIGETFQAPDGRIMDILGGFEARKDSDCAAAAKLTGLHADVVALPDGYDTILDPNAHAVSRALAFRISLTRAVLSGSKLIVVDCPEAALDTDGLARLGDALANLTSRGRTVVVFGRGHWAWGDFDRAYVLKRGRVVEIAGKYRPQRTAAE